MKHKCLVCGIEFALVHERRYTARENSMSGLAAVAGGAEPALHDAFDCPECGCQNVINPRLRKVDTHEHKES